MDYTRPKSTLNTHLLSLSPGDFPYGKVTDSRLMFGVNSLEKKNTKIYKICKSMVCKGLSTTPPFKNHPPIIRIPPPLFLKTPHPPTLPVNRSSQVLLFNRNATVKLHSISIIYVKQQCNVGFFIFKCAFIFVYI